MKKTRSIEMYYGFFLGDTKMWDTIHVDIPASTPPEKVEEVAKAKLARMLAKNKDDAAFMGVYCLNEDEN